MYDFQRKHGHDIDCHVLAPASTCSNKRASTCSTTRASTCITTRASMVLNGASTCITTHASTCITTRASTCHYTRARLLFKNMRPGWWLSTGYPSQTIFHPIHYFGGLTPAQPGDSTTVQLMCSMVSWMTRWGLSHEKQELGKSSQDLWGLPVLSWHSFLVPFFLAHLAS